MRTFILADSQVQAVLGSDAAFHFRDFTDSTVRLPERKTRQDADYPDIILKPVSGTFMHKRTNIGSADSLTLTFGYLSGEQMLSRTFFPLRFAIFRAFVALKRNSPTLGLPFVERVTYDGDQIDDEFSGLTRTRTGRNGWQSLGTITIDFAFDLTDLKLGV